MAQPKKLKGFSIEVDNGGYLISIEIESGETVEFSADRDQLDMIADLIEDCLAFPEANDEAAV